MRKDYNRLRIVIYSSGSTTLVYDNIRRAGNLRFGSQYPGGKSRAASFFVPADPRRSFPIKEGMRVKIYNGFKCVWEGRVRQLTPAVSALERGYTVNCLGHWGYTLAAQKIDKPWADNRLSDDPWRYLETASQAARCRVERQNRIRFTPSGDEWTVGSAAVVYTAPTGQTVKRVTFNYDLQRMGYVSPDAVYWQNGAGGPFTDLTQVYDGDTSTSVGVTITNDDLLYIGTRDPYIADRIRFDIGLANTVASVLSAEYYNGGAWASLTITDGTASGGKPFAQDGDVSYTKPEDWGETEINNTTLYWIRLKVSVSMTAVGFIEAYWGREFNVDLGLYRGAGTLEWSVNTSGTGTQDITLAAANQTVRFLFASRAAQTIPGNGTVYGEVSNVMVYTETGSINGYEIAADIRAAVTELSSETRGIGSLTVDIAPYITDGFKSYADILMDVTSFGGSSYEAWAAYLSNSDGTTDDKPMLVLEAQPALTSADYIIKLSDKQLSTLQFVRGIDDIWNWIVVEYTNSEGTQTTITPDDDASLKDDTSITAYGKQVQILRLSGSSSSALALQYGKAYLARHKNLQWKVNGTIPVQGYINAANGQRVPACEIEPGKRIKIANFLNDMNGSGLTQLITAVEYNDQNQTAMITCGVPDTLEVWLTRRLKQLAQ